MKNNTNSIPGLLGTLAIIGYIIFYLKGKTFADLASFDLLDFLAGLGFAMILYLFLRFILATHNILAGIIGFVILVIVMNIIEEKFGITKLQENIGFAVVGVIGAVLCIYDLCVGIKYAVIDYKYKKLMEQDDNQ